MEGAEIVGRKRRQRLISTCPSILASLGREYTGPNTHCALSSETAVALGSSCRSFIASPPSATSSSPSLSSQSSATSASFSRRTRSLAAAEGRHLVAMSRRPGFEPQQCPAVFSAMLRNLLAELFLPSCYCQCTSTSSSCSSARSSSLFSFSHSFPRNHAANSDVVCAPAPAQRGFPGSSLIRQERIRNRSGFNSYSASHSFEHSATSLWSAFNRNARVDLVSVVFAT